MASRASSKSKAAKSAGRGPAAKSKKTAKKTSGAAPKATGKVGGKSASKAVAKKAPKPKAKAPRAPKLEAATTPASPYHTVTPFLNVRGANDAIEFYKKAFGATERLRMPNPDGTIMHAELIIGDSTIMLSEVNRLPESRSAIHLTVPDCDALFEQALSAGGTGKMPPQDMFWGDRYGQLEDPFGNTWSIATRKEDLSPEEVARRAAAFSASQEQQSEAASALPE